MSSSLNFQRAFIGDPTESSREWYLHVIFAPSELDAYAGQPFPGIVKFQ